MAEKTVHDVLAEVAEGKLSERDGLFQVAQILSSELEKIKLGMVDLLKVVTEPTKTEDVTKGKGA